MKQYGMIDQGHYYMRYEFENSNSDDMHQMMKLLREAGDDAHMLHYDEEQVVVLVYMGFPEATAW